VSLRGFATINFWADDLAAAVAWYTQFLGMEPYFERPGPDGGPAYAEFRVGDYQAELGIIDRKYAPAGTASEPGGAIMYWHVDDLSATVERLLSMGATEYQPITPRGDAGFSPPRWPTRSATCWASCTTRTTSKSSTRSSRHNTRRW
jgi:catechol 2,3-dioxygenase-like lactoylglutathione lyase family enzyme